MRYFHYPADFNSMVASFLRNYQLIWQLTRREVVGRYRGSVLGLAWSLFHPLIMLSVYTFVFSVVFKARMGGVGDSRVDFALGLFIGMIVHAVFTECINRVPTLIINNKTYVKIQFSECLQKN